MYTSIYRLTNVTAHQENSIPWFFLLYFLLNKIKKQHLYIYAVIKKNCI